MSELVTYKANCHCGAVKFRLRIPDFATDKVVRCTCSICTKNGYLLVYPKSVDVEFVSGKDAMTGYKFGGASKTHQFCTTCGTSLFIDFSTSEHPKERPYFAVNLRTFVDAHELIPTITYHEFDGNKKLSPPYKAPEF